VKPWDGSAGRGNAVVSNRKELLFYSKRILNPICQELVKGTEYTCDVYLDFDMKVRCVVPRRRIEVRAGEVSKGQVAKNTRIMSEATSLVEKLGVGPGVITLQLFLTDAGKIKFIEINPRFGGGVPLSIKAGADFPKWILQELIGRKPNIRPNSIKDSLIMGSRDKQAISCFEFDNVTICSNNGATAGQHNQRFHFTGCQQQFAVFALMALVDRKVFTIHQQTDFCCEKLIAGLPEIDAF
jgi:carbamoyl-phosphate synthase large subunit